MKNILRCALITVFLACTACENAGNTSAMTPDELYTTCMQVFQKKGGPLELGEQFCSSMRDACQEAPDSDRCAQAQRKIRSEL